MNILKLLCTFVISVTIGLLSLEYASASQKRILMVVSGHGLNKGETQPGYEFDEFSQAYLIFKHNGISVDVASPQGGGVEADRYKADIPYNRKVLDDPIIMAKLNDTLKINDVSPKDYDAVFIVGGKGAMFDLPDNVVLQSVIADIYQNNGTVGAVCHGPAALTNVTLEDGSYLVAGKVVNSFTNEEEKMFGQKWLPQFDFLLEDKLNERGAMFEKADIMMSHVAVNERLVTGQNPASTPAVAEAFVKSMGIKPKARQPFHDEETLNLIARLLKQEKSARQAYQQSPEKYNERLIGMYGYYRAAYAKTDAETLLALDVMVLVSADMNNTKLDMAIAKGYQKTGQIKKAKSVLEKIIQQHPDFSDAREMLQTL